ncbi:GNAT family N-acetyltransferase [Mammaliicoccus vitulinus]|uniref:GNAT family N-acetyltransferase n=1 Tax=Mammaliicoccus vitulinus TaxID=71237 RepID=UPI003F979876
MEFREIDTNIESLFTEYINEWYENDESVVPWTTDVKEHGGFQEMLVMQKEAINPIDEDFVKAKTFVLIVEQKIVGAVNVRYGLNDFLRNKGGHVGYGVRRSQRGKGYATKLLEYALVELREASVEKALVTCDENNYASAQVILHNNGVESDAFISEDNEVTRRFWINL